MSGVTGGRSSDARRQRIAIIRRRACHARCRGRTCARGALLQRQRVHVARKARFFFKSFEAHGVHCRDGKALSDVVMAIETVLRRAADAECWEGYGVGLAKGKGLRPSGKMELRVAGGPDYPHERSYVLDATLRDAFKGADQWLASSVHFDFDARHTEAGKATQTDVYGVGGVDGDEHGGNQPSDWRAVAPQR